jgi:hypothetical protein
MNPDDIEEQMIAAWNDPFDSEHDPRFLLVQGAKEIRRLRREVVACKSVIKTLHEINEEMALHIRKTQPDPNLPLYVLGIILAGVSGFVAWTLARV